MTEFKHPHGSVFYRRMEYDHPRIVRGEGVYLYDDHGRRYLDACGGAIVVNLGHGIESIARAMQQQAADVAYIHPTMFTCDTVEQYAAALAAITPLTDAKFYFMTSGSEVVEAAIKLARQIQIERGEKKRHLVISRWMSYHGLSLGALAVTGKTKMRQRYLPMMQDMPHIPPPYCYRCPFGLTYPACNLRCADELETEIQRQGAETVAAFIAEPVSGATLGAAVPPDGYWARIQEICHKHGVLLIADEVMTGMGRSGKWFATEHWDVQADLITLGKGMAGGYFPLSALAVRGALVEEIVRGSGGFSHGGTYSHHAVGSAVGLAVLEILTDELVKSVAEKGRFLERLLHEKFDACPIVGDVRGIGLMWGIELVQDSASKRPFDPGLHLAQRIADEAMQRGLIVYPGGGSVDGTAGDHIMLGPPFTISEDQMRDVVEILAKALWELP